MAELINFVSKSALDAEKSQKRVERAKVLRKAREEYERKERILEEKRKRGEDVWILPSVASRLSPDASSNEREDEKHSTKRKKSKKDKKKKKKKRHKSDSEEDEWVEKNPKGVKDDVSAGNVQIKPKQKEAEIKKVEPSSGMEIGQHPRELNPYWRKGGSGLPSQNTTDEGKMLNSAGNRKWFKRAYERAKQQAEDEGRSLTDVAAERWGSLEKLKRLAYGDDELENNEPKLSSQKWKQKEWAKDKGPRSSIATLMRRPKDDDDQTCPTKVRDMKYEAYRRGETKCSGRWRKREKQSDFTKSRSSESTSKKTYLEEKEFNSEKKSNLDVQSSSSTSSSEEENLKEEKYAKVDEDVKDVMFAKVVTEADLNVLGAKRLKAELMGNEELANELELKLKNMREIKEKQDQRGTGKNLIDRNDSNNVVVLTRTDRAGNVRPHGEYSINRKKSGKRERRRKVSTHDEEGKRSRYFYDDDVHDLKSLIAQEKTNTTFDQISSYVKLAAQKLGGQFDLDDKFESAAATKFTPEELEQKSRQKAIREHQKLSAQMDNCKFCLDSPEFAKHLVIAIGLKVYLTLPLNQSLTEGHCLLAPVMHHVAATMIDEDVWSEIKVFKKGLVKMFEEMGKDVIFMEMYRNIHRQQHMSIDCVPVDKEIGHMAPIYFKKAIQEMDSEWAQNKKLINIREKGLRSSIPKGLPYFTVEFGLDGGYAHVIENEEMVPHYFGKEIVGGMLELEPFLWRKPRKENFQTQKKKVLQFAEWWKPFDWTQRIDKK